MGWAYKKNSDFALWPVMSMNGVTNKANLDLSSLNMAWEDEDGKDIQTTRKLLAD